MEMVRFAANLLEICWGNNKINTELNISKITNYRAWRRWVNPWETNLKGISQLPMELIPEGYHMVPPSGGAVGVI